MRSAVDSDALSIGALATQVFLDTYATEGIRPSVAREVQEYFSPAAISALLSSSNTRFILAERAGHLIGFAQLTLGAVHELVLDRPAVELHRLYVQARSAGSGVGTALLREAEAMAAREGAVELWLIVWAENVKALAFYERRGYQELGTDSYVFENEQYETRIFGKTLKSE
ncbi:MAG TPA: GNAT family N-acetyltransferase [Thermoanaerobaculia bacterium]|nr:GNAT family N-acetyltransferase [Thermoanaerobaculia bacterium]